MVDIEDMNSIGVILITTETVSSRHTRADTHMNSQRLWQHAQDVHKFKSDRVSVLRGEVEGKQTQGPTLTKKLSTVDTHWQREKSIFCLWVFFVFVSCFFSFSFERERERDHKVGWVGRWEGPRRSWRKEKHN